MRKEFFILLFTLTTQLLCAQTISITHLKNNIAYAGGLNQIEINVKGYSCKNLIVSTNNGKLERKNTCWYDFFPTDTGLARILVKTKIKNKITTVAEATILVRDVDAKFYIGQLHAGKVKKEFIVHQQYVRVEAYELGCVYYYPIFYR